MISDHLIPSLHVPGTAGPPPGQPVCTPACTRRTVAHELFFPEEHCPSLTLIAPKCGRPFLYSSSLRALCRQRCCGGAPRRVVRQHPAVTCRLTCSAERAAVGCNRARQYTLAAEQHALVLWGEGGNERVTPMQPNQSQVNQDRPSSSCAGLTSTHSSSRGCCPCCCPAAPALLASSCARPCSALAAMCSCMNSSEGRGAGGASCAAGGQVLLAAGQRCAVPSRQHSVAQHSVAQHSRPASRTPIAGTTTAPNLKLD